MLIKEKKNNFEYYYENYYRVFLLLNLELQEMNGNTKYSIILVQIINVFFPFSNVFIYLFNLNSQKLLFQFHNLTPMNFKSGS